MAKYPVPEWKDELLPGASRQALPWSPGGGVLPGYVGDSNPDPQAGYQQRNDWVDAGGVPVISGSSEYWGWVNYGIRPSTSATSSGGPLTGPNKDEAAASRTALGSDGNAGFDAQYARRGVFDVGR